jgi:hypothetical protein
MIGDIYNTDHWNCTHEVAQWYELNGLGQVLTPVAKSEWDIRFIKWMRKHFTPIDELEQGALVVMENRYGGGLHIGVWDDGMVHHCYKPANSIGQAIRSPLYIVKLTHKIIRYGRYNG